MTKYSAPSVLYHSLSGMVSKLELEVALSAASASLDLGHVNSIVNAFFKNTKICVTGVPYIKIQGLSSILRTGSSGAERPLVYQGLAGIVSPAEIVNIDGFEHISGPTLVGLIHARIHFKSGATKQYLNIALDLYTRIINLAAVRDLKDVFLGEIDNNRPYLKSERITRYGISCCELSGSSFDHPNQVEFSHIESVVVNPMKALDVDNGLIVLKGIHLELTRKQIHTYEQLYDFCAENGYSTNWA
ncbi:hypothetical protein [Cupriavidus sp. a3]|uniref:hypothetical protein n=1 Tax=Cupriavidus sp. a3 TaxID=3242158 RepID=UPI003D9C5FA3